MALTVQNLRAVDPGVEPASLLPGQIAFNTADKIIFVGDGSNFRTDFTGVQSTGVPGAGWYSLPMDFNSLGDYFVPNPQLYGDTPTDQQVLTWSSILGHPIWTSNGAGGGAVYVTSNAAVAVAPGATTSAKISAAIGIVSPDEGNVAIVTGLPDDVYEGLYFFTTEWVKGASYAYPSATEVIYNNTAHPSLGPTVQLAIDDLDNGLTATTAIANTANSTATSALSIANAALPKAGGTMTGDIIAKNIDITSGSYLKFAGGANGGLIGVSDSTSSSLTNVAASSLAVKTAYDLATAALPLSGGTMTGTINFAAGQTFPISGIQDATTTQKGVVQVGNNIEVAAGVISILDASTANKGVVQLNDTVTSTSDTEAATANAAKVAYDAGIQGQVDAAAALAAADAAIPDATFTASGELIVGTGSGTYTTLAPGATNYILQSNGDGTLSWVPDSSGDVTSVSGTAPITVDNTNPQTPIVGINEATNATLGVVQVGTNIQLAAGVISINDATTSQKGLVELVDTLNSTSTTKALTARAGADLQSQIDSLANASNLVLAGGFDASTGLMQSVTSDGAAQSFVVGSPLPPPAPGNNDYYVIVVVAGNNPHPAINGDWFVSDGSTWEHLAVGPIQSPASYTQQGIVQLADTAAVYAGTSDSTAVTPNSLYQNMSDSVTTSDSHIIASATAAKLAHDAAVAAQATADAAIPKATFTAAGQLLYGTGAGTYNVLPIGTEGQSLIVSGGNVAWGASLAGYTCTALPFNTAFGAFAGDSITGGSNNTMIGHNTGTAITVGTANTLIGGNAGDSITTGGVNTAVGFNALHSATTGGCNVAIGAGALSSSTTACCNIAIGYQTLESNSTGVRNTAVGTQAGRLITTGSDNTIVGFAAGDTATGTNNTLIGSNAGSALTLGGTNILIGANAGDTITTGFNNTIIGDVNGSASLTDTLILAAGTTVKFQANVSGAWSYNGTDFGTAGQFLASQGSAATPIWCTLSLACVPCAAFTAKGDILVGTAANTFSALPVGANGQVLVPNSSCTTGLEWVTTTALSLQGYTCTATPFNTAVGSGAGVSIAGGTSNTNIGFNAGTSISVGSNNTLVGTNTGDAITTGGTNTAVGFNALTAATTGGCNVAIGGGALSSNTTTSSLVAVGFQALSANTSGLRNTAVGTSAGQTLSTGCDNTLVGFGSGAALTTAVNNTLIGSCAGDSLTTGANNTVLGQCALASATTASNNIAIGYSSLAYGTGGGGNVAIGLSAGANISTGQNNVILGNQAGDALTTASNTVAIGWGAVSAATTGASNVGVGFNSLAVATSSNNTAVGFCSGAALTTGATNVFIGNTAGDAVTTGSNNTIIGDIAGSTTLADTLILAAGANCKLTVNENNAIQIGNAGGYGTAGQVLMSNGPGAAAGWNTVAGGVPATPTLEGLLYGYVDDTNTNDNTALGLSALGAAGTAGYGNTAVGWEAGSLVTSGQYNLFVGWGSGANITTESGNVLLNSPGIAGQSNMFIVGNASTGDPHFAVNGSDAIGVADGVGGLDYGTAGYILQSNGTAAPPSWVANSGGGVQSVSGTSPITIDNTDPLNPVVEITPASTLVSGAVQLNDTVSSTSTTQALTANQGKNLQDQISSLTVATNLTFAGTFNASTSQMESVSVAGTAAGFTVGNNLPSPGAGNTDYFVIVTTGASYSPPGGGGPFATSQGDWLLSNGTAWQYLNVGLDLPVATPTSSGAVLGCSTASSTALGCNALVSNPSGAGNIGIGINAGCAITGGINNSVMGACAGDSITTGCYNVAIGASAGCSLTTANANVLIGTSAGCLATGQCNVIVGATAGCDLTTGSFNVAIGTGVQVASATGSCQLAIGFNSSSNWLTGDSNLNIRPGGNIIDCNNVQGAAGAVLTSVGPTSNRLQWANYTGPWIDGGAIGLSSVGTPAPSFTTTINKVFYRQVGPKDYEVIYKLEKAAAVTVTSAGVGDWLFTLPAGLTFNTSLPFQTAFTGFQGTNSFGFTKYLISGPTVNHVWDGTKFSVQAQPAVFNSTQFRVINYSATVTAGSFVQDLAPLSSFWFNPVTANQWQMQIQFQFTAA